MFVTREWPSISFVERRELGIDDICEFTGTPQTKEMFNVHHPTRTANDPETFL